jgi:hypothetical protein
MAQLGSLHIHLQCMLEWPYNMSAVMFIMHMTILFHLAGQGQTVPCCCLPLANHLTDRMLANHRTDIACGLCQQPRRTTSDDQSSHLFTVNDICCKQGSCWSRGINSHPVGTILLPYETCGRATIRYIELYPTTFP